MSRRPLIVVGVGGNAINPPGDDPSLAAERVAIDTAAIEIAALGEDSARLLVVHGNGPQVGRLLAAPVVGDPSCLDIHVAQTQGELGYLLAEAIERETAHSCVAVVTRVVVDEADPAFANATKPIGPLLDQRPTDHASAPTPDGSGWRRVVASPRPRAVVETVAIGSLLHSHHVVAGGGGGIPVAVDDRGRRGMAAVIDKDWVAAMLAIDLDAESLVFVTDVESAFDRFGETTRVPLRALPTGEARSLLDRGVFAAGSMAPKIESAVQFVEASGRRAHIAQLGKVAATMRGESGTTVFPEAT